MLPSSYYCQTNYCTGYPRELMLCHKHSGLLWIYATEAPMDTEQLPKCQLAFDPIDSETFQTFWQGMPSKIPSWLATLMHSQAHASIPSALSVSNRAKTCVISLSASIHLSKLSSANYNNSSKSYIRGFALTCIYSSFSGMVWVLYDNNTPWTNNLIPIPMSSKPCSMTKDA